MPNYTTPSLNKLKDLFHSLQQSVLMLRDFDFGPAYNLKSEHQYPLLFVEPQNGQVFRSGPYGGSLKVFEQSFNLIVVDRIAKGDDNYNECLSDCQYILQTLITYLDRSETLVDLGINTSGNVFYQPVFNRFDADLNGWQATITLRFANYFNTCNIPVLPTLNFTIPQPVISDYISFDAATSSTYQPNYTTPTLNQIRDIFYSISVANVMVHDFGFGPTYNIDDISDKKFPLMYVEPDRGQAIRSDEGSGSMKVFEQSFNIYVLDKIAKGQENFEEVLSNCQYILQTIVTLIDRHPLYNALSLNTSGNIEYKPVFEVTSYDCNGWKATITLRYPNRFNLCNIPVLPSLSYNNSVGVNALEYRLIGPTGPQGPTGSQGPQGNQGNTGLNGATGSQGNTGLNGATGSQGPQGNQGNTGLNGATGSQGPQGNQGNTGLNGATGSQGPQGNTGLNGATGSQGNTGLNGATGSQGPQGNTGLNGATGSQGTQGNQGNTGLNGATGSTGSQGPQGNQGDIGLIGATGPQGNQGDIGVTGSQGNTGLNGATGPQGNQGNIGPQGTYGPIGPAGLVWQGLWQSGVTYSQNDSVSFASASWFCFATVSSVTTPNTDATHWALLAAQGANGSQGPQGSNGIIIIGPLDSQTLNNTGATVSGSNLVLQSGSTAFPGLINTSTQSFRGIKTFTSTTFFGASVSYSGPSNSTFTIVTSTQSDITILTPNAVGIGLTARSINLTTGASDQATNGGNINLFANTTSNSGARAGLIRITANGTTIPNSPNGMGILLGSSNGGIEIRSIALGASNSAGGNINILTESLAGAGGGGQAAAASINDTTGAGGIGSNALTGGGGPGGDRTISLGAGGLSLGTNLGVNPGNAGNFIINGGQGGTTNALGTHSGGTGSQFLMISGRGGSATGSTSAGTLTGGNGGRILLRTGAAGTGTTTNGLAGVFSVGIGADNNSLLVDTTRNVIINSTNKLLLGTSVDNGTDILQANGSFLTTKVNFTGATSGTLGVRANPITTPHTLTMPAVQGSASTFLTNDGSGNLSWSNALDYTNTLAGTASLIAGTATVLTSAVRATDLIIVSANTIIGTPSIHCAPSSLITPSVSFVISTNGNTLDNSVINWMIIHTH